MPTTSCPAATTRLTNALMQGLSPGYVAPAGQHSQTHAPQPTRASDARPAGYRGGHGYDRTGRSGGTGRRAGLKIPCPSGRVGSTPTSGIARVLPLNPAATCAAGDRCYLAARRPCRRATTSCEGEREGHERAAFPAHGGARRNDRSRARARRGGMRRQQLEALRRRRGPAPTCPTAARVSWQKLANEIRAPVYCPSWLPQPLVGRSTGSPFNGHEVDPDRSYLVKFLWFDSGLPASISEVHVNLRGYPGNPRIPTCDNTLSVNGKTLERPSPCFSDPKPGKTAVREDRRDPVHREPGRRPVASPVRVAPQRLPLLAFGARRRPVHVQAGRREPRPDDAKARPGRAEGQVADLTCA